jgi:hypothetical protein
MRCVPERPVSTTFFTLIGSFVAGPFIGLRLGLYLAPDSELAQVASTFAFPLAFCAGLVFWLGLGVASVILGALPNLLRGKRPPAAHLDASQALVPPGYGSFVVFSVLGAGAAGVCVGLLSQASLPTALACYGAAGTLYGVALRTLAHHGYLPFPEPS